MNNTANNKLLLGFDLNMWNAYKTKIPIVTDISLKTNSHIIIAGMSGGGKSYYEQWLFKNLISASSSNADSPNEYIFADYKGDDSFDYLRNCAKYYSYKNTTAALNLAYSHLNDRLGGDNARHSITLIIDEYMAYILSLINEDKKQATEIMNKVSEILLMGRSMGIRLIASMQRPDALAFSAGSRLNFGIVVIVGAAVRSIYEMLIPDFVNQVEGRIFGRGEGVIVLQGSQFKFFKCPIVRDVDGMREICKNALS